MTPLAEAAFPAEWEQVPAVTAWVASHAAAAGMSPDRLLWVELAVEEMFSNLCRHVPAGTLEKVRIRLFSDEDSFGVELADQGPAFDPLAAPEPDLTAPLESRSPGGLGLMLTRKVAREMRYRREAGRNIVTLEFALSE